MEVLIMVDIFQYFPSNWKYTVDNDGKESIYLYT